MIPALPRLPAPTVALLDRNGAISPAWYDWFRAVQDRTQRLIKAVNDHEIRITTLEPP